MTKLIALQSDNFRWNLSRLDALSVFLKTLSFSRVLHSGTRINTSKHLLTNGIMVIMIHYKSTFTPLGSKSLSLAYSLSSSILNSLFKISKSLQSYRVGLTQRSQQVKQIYLLSTAGKRSCLLSKDTTSLSDDQILSDMDLSELFPSSPLPSAWMFNADIKCSAASLHQIIILFRNQVHPVFAYLWAFRLTQVIPTLYLALMKPGVSSRARW